MSLLDGQGQACAPRSCGSGPGPLPSTSSWEPFICGRSKSNWWRLNLGLSRAALAQLATVRLDVVRRHGGKVVLGREIAATPATIQAQRDRLPQGLREDLANLLLADLDVSSLPLQPFGDPQRNWFVRATAPRCRGQSPGHGGLGALLPPAHQEAQPAIAAVTIKSNLLYVNNQPWIPWGAVYGHVPVYDGPADPGPGKYLDLHNLPRWSMYDRFTAEPYSRRRNDFNCMRYVAASITDPKTLDKLWTGDNLYASSVFVVPDPVFSLEKLPQGRRAGQAGRLPVVCQNRPDGGVAGPGIEEAFGNFHAATRRTCRAWGRSWTPSRGRPASR